MVNGNNSNDATLKSFLRQQLITSTVSVLWPELYTPTNLFLSISDSASSQIWTGLCVWCYCGHRCVRTTCGTGSWWELSVGVMGASISHAKSNLSLFKGSALPTMLRWQLHNGWQIRVETSFCTDENFLSKELQSCQVRIYGTTKRIWDT